MTEYLVPTQVIKAARAMLNWTQKELADAVGTDVTTIARYESGGRMREQTLDRIIDIFETHGVEVIFKNKVAIGVRFNPDDDS